MNPISPKDRKNAKEIHDALEDLHKKYKSLMFTEAKNILKDAHLAEDAMQQSFIQVIKNLHKIDETNVPATKNFLVIICRNISLNMLKKTQYLNKNSEDINEVEVECHKASPADLMIDNESVQRIIKAIEELPTKYRDAMFLKYFHHASITDMMKIFDEPYDTVQKRLYRAKDKLKKILEREGIA